MIATAIATTPAAQQIEKAVDQQPDNAEFWATWGNIQFQAGEYPSAIEKYQEATKLAPEKPDYWTFLALAFLEMKRSTNSRQPCNQPLTYRSGSCRLIEVAGRP